MDTLQFFVYGLVGFAISYLEERFGSFQNASPGVKQVVNGALSLVLPAVIAWLSGWWKPEFGDIEAVVTQLVYVAVPVGVWLVTQGTHLFDKGVGYLKEIAANQ